MTSFRRRGKRPSTPAKRAKSSGAPSWPWGTTWPACTSGSGSSRVRAMPPTSPPFLVTLRAIHRVLRLRAPTGQTCRCVSRPASRISIAPLATRPYHRTQPPPGLMALLTRMGLLLLLPKVVLILPALGPPLRPGLGSHAPATVDPAPKRTSSKRTPSRLAAESISPTLAPRRERSVLTRATSSRTFPPPSCETWSTRTPG